MKKEIINTYDRVSKDFGYNSNSLHKLGLNSRKIEKLASKQILDVLGLNDYEVIYTSGNAESFTMILNNVKESLYTDIDNMIAICKDKNISFTSSIDKVDNNTFVSTFDDSLFIGRINHIDVDLSKTYKNLNKFDFITIEDDIPFFGVLLKRKNLEICNLIHGGKSTTKYRSGTSVTSLIASFSKLVKLKYKK